MFTQIVTQLTLVHIFTSRGLSTELVSWRTVALVAALSVQTRPSTAQQWVTLALVNVHAVFHHHKAALVAVETLALEAAWCVHTHTMTTQVRRDRTFVDICAVPLLHCQGETTITATLEAADSVSTRAVSAEPPKHLTLIHIFVEGSPSQNVSAIGDSGSSRADSLEFISVWFWTGLTVHTPRCTHCTTAHVHTIAARQRLHTFVLIPLHITLLTAHVNTCSSGSIQCKSLRTLTSERALSVHTTAVCTDTRKHLTLIDIFTYKSLHATKPFRTGWIDFAAFTWASPGGPERGAALRLQRGPVYIHLAAAVLDIQPAGPLHAVYADGVGGVQLAAVRTFAVEGTSYVAANAIDAGVGVALVDVFASLRVGLEGESFGAGTGVASRCVSTHAVVTQQAVHQTLINVHAVLPTSIRLITDITDATVAPAQILANPILTYVWIQSAFVYISSVCSDPRSTAAHRLELGGVERWAGLARLSETMFRVGAAAFGLCDCARERS